MIAQLTGTIALKEEEFVVLNVGGVGYKVFVSENTRTQLVGMEGTVTLNTHMYVRENSQDLYGFMTIDEIEMFELLLSISGIGPKAALGILSQASPNEVKHAISTGDTSVMTKVSGVGKKTAERVVLELKSKIDDFEITEISTGEQIMPLRSPEATDALVALGCSEQEAKQALAAVDPSVDRVEEQVKEALKILGSK